MSQVLVILTSHGQLGSTGQATGVGLQTFASPYYALKEAGVEVVVASPLGGDPPVDPLSFGEGVETVALRRLNEDVDARALLRASLPLRKAARIDYDGLFFAGGHGGMWDFPDDPVIGGLIAAAMNAGKPVAAVCHGPWVLCSTPALKGRTATGFHSIKDDMVNAGATFVDMEVCIDGNVITSRTPAD
ncbi:MAG TPA: type 1 glutamine amidotransferase domain-containing protein, partial [Nonomuraea sp.]|nr:type 1 glutamine amidotransferase domain-containing protein [Nonomuraea sp.]